MSAETTPMWIFLSAIRRTLATEASVSKGERFSVGSYWLTTLEKPMVRGKAGEPIGAVPMTTVCFSAAPASLANHAEGSRAATIRHQTGISIRFISTSLQDPRSGLAAPGLPSPDHLTGGTAELLGIE